MLTSKTTVGNRIYLSFLGEKKEVQAEIRHILKTWKKKNPHVEDREIQPDGRWFVKMWRDA